MRSSTDLPRAIPLERWDADQIYSPDASTPGSMYVRHGIFLQNIDAFDASAFRLTAAEAISMDPQQRLLLEQTSFALEEVSR
jgi:polyketide synthase 12